VPIQFSLTPEEAEYVRTNNTIFCHEFDIILPYHDPMRGRAWVNRAWIANAQIFADALSEQPVADDTRSRYVDAAMVLLRRPDWTPFRPTWMKILEPLPKCDTNNKKDIVRMLNHAVSRPEEPLVVRVVGDGQSVINFKQAKATRKERYGNIWIDPADMHAFAHCVYAGHSLFWTCFSEACAKRLQRRHIEAHPVNLDDDRFDHHKMFVLVQYCAIMAYLHTIFPMEVMLDPVRLMRAVQHNAGLLVLSQFALIHGSPIATWVRAVRSNDGLQLDELWQYYYHLHRASHKTTYSCISIIRAVNRYCVLRTLRNIKVNRATISMSGRKGCNAPYDK
jgi:hypothetical protein